jgi:hypothetical protein
MKNRGAIDVYRFGKLGNAFKEDLPGWGMENCLEFRDMIFVVMIRVAAVEKTRGNHC